VDIDFFSEQLMSKNNVKRAISYYMDEDSILDTINIIQSHFDKKGRLIEHIEINQELIKANFVQIKTTTKYHFEEDKMVCAKKYRDFELVEKVIKEFNEENKLKKEKHFLNDKLIYLWEYSYDNIGNKTMFIKTLESGEVDTISYSYEYNDDNRIVKMFKGNVLIKYFEYDDMGREIYMEEYSPTGNKVFEFYLQYYPDSTIKDQLTQKDLLNHQTYRWTYYYDDSWKLLRETAYPSKTVWKYVYNKDGLLIWSEINNNISEYLDGWKYEYEFYDSYP
jgi:YD repeat-containing protein